MKTSAPKIGLFVTCLVDLFRPTVGFAAVALLENAGCRVGVPEHQTCCGQPAYNSGDRQTTRRLARQVISAFKGYDYVVVSSGSCAGMIRQHYPALFDRDAPAMAACACSLSEKTYELVSFLTDVMKIEAVGASFDTTATYHDSCSGLRELGIKEQPRRLLSHVRGLTLKEMNEPEICCGFGGTFCIKYQDISSHMAGNKVQDILSTGAETLLAGDMGCLLNMAGKLEHMGAKVNVRHVAEVLAGMTGCCAPIV
jgi:L-lactate dehydrogenase complex protein LldE